MANFPQLDRDQYDFHPITNIPRTFLQTSRGYDPVFTELTGVFDPLLNKVLRRHPDWQAVVLPYYGQSGVPRFTSSWVNHIYVVTKDWEQVLGTLDYSRGMYQISNGRVANDMTRKRSIDTKDLAKAVKLVDKYFYPKLDVELFQELQSTATQAVHYIKRAANTKYIDSTNALANAAVIRDAIIPNIDVLLASPGLTDKDRGELALLPERREALVEARTQEKNVEKNSKLLVRVEGETYHVSMFKTWNAPGEFAHLSSSELAPDVRTKLAMLKLVTVEKVIPDVGIRLGTNTYLIFHNDEGENA